MAFGLGAAAVADVEWRTNLGVFKTETTEAQRVYLESTGKMTKQAIEMSVAQEKLDRAITKFGPNSIQARQATLAYRNALSSTGHESDQLRRHQERTSTSLTRTTRGAIAASGAFKGLGNALFFASGAFAGAFGIVYGIRKTIEAAARAQVIQAQLEKAVRNSGVAWDENSKKIESNIHSLVRLTAFDDEDLKQTFASLIIRTKNVNDAFTLLNLSADVARQRHIGLQQASILVTRASLGQTASLRRLGIDVQKVTTEQDKLRASGVKVTFEQRKQAKAADDAATRLSVITQLQAKFGGQAKVYAESAAGAQERFNAVLQDSEEIIGQALLPTVTRLLQQAANWIDKQNQSGRLQKEVNADLKQAGIIIHGVVDAFKLLRAILSPIIDLFGGLHNAVEFLLVGALAYKIGKVAIAIRGMGKAFGILGTAAEVNAAKAVAAENAVGDAAVVNAGKVGILSRALMGIGGLAGLAGTAALVVGGVAVADVAAIVAAGGGGGARNSNWKKYPNVVRLYNKLKSGKPLTAAERTILAALPKDASLDTLSDKQLKALDKALSHVYGTDMTTAQARAGAQFTPQAPAGSAPGGKGGGGNRPPARTEADIQLDIARAQAQNNQQAELKYLNELENLYKRQAAALEKIPHKTLLQVQKLTQLYGEIDSTQAQIDQINQANAAKAAASAAKSKAAARKQHAAYIRALDTRETHLRTALLRAAATEGTKDDKVALAALIAFYKARAHDAELTAKEKARYENREQKAKNDLAKARKAGVAKRADLEERKLRNAVLAAQITDGYKDDEKALRALIAFYRKMEKNDALSDKARLEYQRKRLQAQKTLAADLKKDAQAKKQTTTQSALDFLGSLQGTLNTYGGNLFGFGELSVGGRAGDASKMTAAHTVIQTSLMRDNTKAVKKLAERLRNPSSRAAYNTNTSLYDGYAF